MVLVRLVRGGGRGEGGAMHVYHIVRQANAACIFYFRYASARRSGNNELPWIFFFWGGERACIRARAHVSACSSSFSMTPFPFFTHFDFVLIFLSTSPVSRSSFRRLDSPYNPVLSYKYPSCTTKPWVNAWLSCSHSSSTVYLFKIIIILLQLQEGPESVR